MTSSTNLPERGFIDGLLGFHVRLAQLRLFADFAAAVDDPALTPLLAGALFVIAANPGTNQRDLAGLLAADPSTMVRLIDQLVKRGWVIRETAERDRRNTVPRVTPQGSAMLEHLSSAIRSSEDRVAARLSARERKTLITLLRRLTEEQSE